MFECIERHQYSTALIRPGTFLEGAKNHTTFLSQTHRVFAKEVSTAGGTIALSPAPSFLWLLFFFRSFYSAFKKYVFFDFS
jgi:hypothetical protein